MDFILLLAIVKDWIQVRTSRRKQEIMTADGDDQDEDDVHNTKRIILQISAQQWLY